MQASLQPPNHALYFCILNARIPHALPAGSKKLYPPNPGTHPATGSGRVSGGGVERAPAVGDPYDFADLVVLDRNLFEIPVHEISAESAIDCHLIGKLRYFLQS